MHSKIVPTIHLQISSYNETQVRVHLVMHVVFHWFELAWHSDGPSDEYVSSEIFHTF